MKSKTNKKKIYTATNVVIPDLGLCKEITATVMFSHSHSVCRNSKTLTITGGALINDEQGISYGMFGDMMHDTIAIAFPELSKYLKWHSWNTKIGGLYYLSSTLKYANEGNLNKARTTALFPNGTLEELKDEKLLKSRLNLLLEQFKADVKSLGFTW